MRQGKKCVQQDRSTRLCDGNLGKINREVETPAYDRNGISTGIVHIGTGAFHRAHQAVYVDDCLAAGERDWGIVGASLRSPDTRDALGPQDGLYTLAVQDKAGERLRVIGSIAKLLVAPEDPQALVAYLADKATRIVTLTVTEKAYLRRGDGKLDLDHPDIAWDLSNPQRPRTVYGFLSAGLENRFASGLPAFTVLCCDNLPANGETVRQLFLEYVTARGSQYAEAMADVAFPSTMVDRIVPATTDEDRSRISGKIGVTDAWPVKTEPFMQWVIEDQFPLGRPRWERFGVTMVEDVRPFEEMKLRLLNGAHSAMAYLGLLVGRASVAEAFNDPDIRTFINGLWEEAIPTLPREAGLEPDKYTAALAERFSNPALVHRTAQIAMDGSQKLPQRILAAAATRLRDGAPTGHLLTVVAAWIACCEARGRTLPAGHFADPLDDRLADLFSGMLSVSELVAQVFQVAGFTSIDESGEIARRVAVHLDAIRNGGALAAMRMANA